ncbi:hypothetical protein QG37_05072 [Candidozyma auris]|nr:hypothetical protein QG37_05072 [[Candida] auris]
MTTILFNVTFVKIRQQRRECWMINTSQADRVLSGRKMCKMAWSRINSIKVSMIAFFQLAKNGSVERNLGESWHLWVSRGTISFWRRRYGTEGVSARPLR